MSTATQTKPTGGALKSQQAREYLGGISEPTLHRLNACVIVNVNHGIIALEIEPAES